MNGDLTMDYLALASGAVYLIVSLIVSIAALMMTCWVMSNISSKRFHLNNGLKNRSISNAICFVGYILAMTIMMKNSMSSGITYLQAFIHADDPQFADVLISMGLIGLQFLVSFVLSILSLIISLEIYSRITAELDEIAEIENGNIAVALVFTAVIISTATFLAPGIEMVTSTIVPLTIH
ncbi:DUF350 domain-containing protein [Polynucleobacter sp. JS-Polo-80-F4]|uniref:DUF350 domain-containing protein n=1 Tax=Polynucleobacter sp. JS-Polo-80-F4 TaxID=2576918 RepID=UPI001C0D4FB6|nr:DUF350 domain-containing protein [Polynucleobacter sp. JS-Polo-80-F4]MBU3617287.1 DUF350 domain-containing protein [Polynucleobacter sp. JS-Polo-80-F4]